jgi:5-methylcytosine-specific restriction protein A
MTDELPTLDPEVVAIPAAARVLLALLAAKPEYPRSPRWPAVAHAHLKAHPACAACGGTDHLQVHHVRPFHLFPKLELDPTNLITLCESGRAGVLCHLHYGHCGDWSASNPGVRDHATAALTMLHGALRAAVERPP